MTRDKPDLRALMAPLIVKRGVRAVARTVGMDPANLTAWLKGRRDISASTIQELIHVLGLRIDKDPSADEGKDS